MRRDLRRNALGLACAGLLLAAVPAFAQRSSSFGSSGAFSSTSIGGGSSSFGGSSSSGGMGGNSAFGGGMSGNSGFGGSSGLGGNSGFLSGSNLGGTSGVNTGRGGTTQIGSTSFLGSSYGNPLAMGLSSSSGTTTTSTAFGNALYNLNSSRSGTATTSSSSTANRQNSQFGAGFNIRRLPAYATTLKIKDLPPPPTGAEVRSDIQGMIAASPDLDSRDSVRVLIDGSAVVLQGQVVDDDERRLVENMVLLTPHVYQVRNELKTAPAVAAARVP